MKSLYIIRDKNTGAVCSSAKNCYFDADITNASLFDSLKNAEKAVRSMMKFLTTYNSYGGCKWFLTDSELNMAASFFHSLKKEYIEMLESYDHLKALAEANADIPEAQLDLEIVEVKLTVVG